MAACVPHRLPDRAQPLQALEARLRVGRRLPHHGRERGWRAGAGLQAEAELLRSRRRHRAGRRRAAPALRASGGARAVVTAAARPHLLRRRQHQDARPQHARAQGELLQVHQRDAPRPSRTPTEHSDQRYLCAINGTAAGGGYELALACDQILLVDDGSSAVSLPELPLLGVLPGTGGLTRLVDKRRVRRDHADFFCTIAEGIKGKRALEWKLVDEIAPAPRLADETRRSRRGRGGHVRSGRRTPRASPCPPSSAPSTATAALSGLVVDDRPRARATATLPCQRPSRSTAGRRSRRSRRRAPSFWPLALARALDDAMLHLRLNEPEIGIWVLHSQGDGALVEAYDALLASDAGDWLVREIVLYWKRTLKRLDVTSRSLIALVEPGTLLRRDLARAGARRRPHLHAGRHARGLEPAGSRGEAHRHRISAPMPMGNGLTRLQTRFLDEPKHVGELQKRSASDSTPRRPTNWASSPSRPTTSTGRTRCASRSRSARASRPMR